MAVATDFDLDSFVVNDYSRVVAAIALITGNRQQAEDAVGDAIVKLLTHPPVTPLRSPAAWITTVASNLSRTGHRRRGAEERSYRRSTGGRVDEATGDPTAGVADSMAIMASIDRLPLRQRQICVLHYYLDCSIADIAASLEVAEGTVKTQLHRARVSLAAELGLGDPGDAGSFDDEESSRG